jgi:hypothetical protein
VPPATEICGTPASSGSATVRARPGSSAGIGEADGEFADEVLVISSLFPLKMVRRHRPTVCGGEDYKINGRFKIASGKGERHVSVPE